MCSHVITHLHTHLHILAYSHPYTHTLLLTQTYSLTHIHIRIYSDTLTHINSHTYTSSQPTHTITHTHTLSTYTLTTHTFTHFTPSSIHSNSCTHSHIHTAKHTYSNSHSHILTLTLLTFAQIDFSNIVSLSCNIIHGLGINTQNELGNVSLSSVFWNWLYVCVFYLVWRKHLLLSSEFHGRAKKRSHSCLAWWTPACIGPKCSCLLRSRFCAWLCLLCQKPVTGSGSSLPGVGLTEATALISMQAALPRNLLSLASTKTHMTLGRALGSGNRPGFPSLVSFISILYFVSLASPSGGNASIWRNGVTGWNWENIFPKSFSGFTSGNI